MRFVSLFDGTIVGPEAPARGAGFSIECHKGACPLGTVYFKVTLNGKTVLNDASVYVEDASKLAGEIKTACASVNNPLVRGAPDLESLAARVAELERKLAEK